MRERHKIQHYLPMEYLLKVSPMKFVANFMASTVRVDVAALTVFNELALLTAVSFEMPPNHNLIRVNG